MSVQQLLETCLGRPGRDNAIDQYLLEKLPPEQEKQWQKAFKQVPERLTPDEKRTWLDGLKDVVLGSDAFIPFRDNIDRAVQSGVKYVIEPGGSMRNEEVVAACDEYGMVMVESGIRLFHH